METTNYILSIIEAHPAITSIYLSQQVFQLTLREELPTIISTQEWSNDWCEARDASNQVLVHFKA